MARLGERPVICKHEAGALSDTYLLQIVAEGLEQRPRVRHLERGDSAPLAEVGWTSRPVRVQEAAANLPERTVQVRDLLPVVDPLIRAHERDPRPLRRPLAKLVEEEGEPRAEPLSRRGPHPLNDFRRDLVPEQAAAVQHLPDGGANRFDVLGVERRVNHPRRIALRGQASVGRA